MKNRLLRDFIILTLILISIVFLSNSILQQRKDSERSRLKSVLESIVRIENQNLNNWFDNHTKNINWIVSQQELVNFTHKLLALKGRQDSLINTPIQKEIRSYLSPFIQNYDYNGIFIIAPDYTSISSMRDENIGSKNFLYEIDSIKIKLAFEGQTVFYSPTQNELKNRLSEFTMFILTPIRNNDGEIISIFSIRLKPENYFTASLEKSWLGETSNTYAFDRNGILITKSRFAKSQGDALYNEQLQEKPLNIEKALNKINGTNINGYINYDNNKVFGSWVWNEKLKIGITTEISEAEALSYYYDFRKSFIITISIIILLIVILFIIYVRGQSKSKKELQNKEFKLSELENSVNNFVENAPVGIAINSMDGVFVRINKEMEKFTGYTVNELNKLSYWDITPKEYEKEEEIQLASLAKDKRYGPYEKEYIHKEGYRFSVLLSGVVIKGDDGEEYIWSIIQDISDRTKKEIELKEQEKRYRTLVENIPGAVYRCADDEYWTMSYISDQIENISGYPPSDFIDNSSISYASIIHPDDVKKVDEEINRSRKKGESFTIEYRIIHKNTSIRWIYEQGRIINENHKNKYIDGFLMEITDRKLLEEELIISKNISESANKAKSSFLANMSHEIKTPMNAILGHTQILQQSDNLTVAQIKNLNSISKSGEHLISLISDILDLSKIEAGKVVLNKSNINLKEMLKELHNLFSINALKNNISLSINISPNLPDIIYGDEQRIRQVVINLLSNAIKFTQKGGVNIKAELDNNFIKISIKDTGVGILEENLNKIFKVFEQSESGLMATGGFGLGLSISRDLAILMGGDITVSSKVNKGSEFTFSFLHEISTEMNSKTENPKRVLMLDSNSKGKKVLIIDDVIENLEVAKAILEPVGFKTKILSEGNSAVENGIEFMPDVILIDLHMPNVNIINVTKELRSNQKLSKTPIIAVSASIFEEDKAKFYKAGIDDFVSKPYKINDLLNTIKKHIYIDYIYDSTTPLLKKQTYDFNTELNQIQLGSELIRQIVQASTIGDIDQLNELNKQIAQSDKKLAQEIQVLIDDFEIDKINTLFSNLNSNPKNEN